MKVSIKKQRFLLYDVIFISYIATSILTKQIYLNFDPVYLKSLINVWLATKYQNIYQHMEIFSKFYVPSFKFKIQNKLSNKN